MPSLIDRISAFFLGSSTHLRDDAIIFDEAWQQRHKMYTSYIGEVSLSFQGYSLFST